MEYTSTFVGNNMYQIETTNNNENIIFNVVVANDESEIEGLVEFHLDSINNPQPIAPQEPVQPTKSELLAQLQALQAQIESLA
jgi:hypothetical protein